MKTHLKSQKTGSTNHFHFRSRIPQDLIGHFDGKREFQISLRSVSDKQTILVSLIIKNRLQELFGEIRTGMESLGSEEIKEILRLEVRKQILHAHHVHLDTNELSVDLMLRGGDFTWTDKDVLEKTDFSNFLSLIN